MTWHDFCTQGNTKERREENTFWLLNVNLQINNKKNKKKTDKRNEIVLQQMCKI